MMTDIAHLKELQARITEGPWSYEIQSSIINAHPTLICYVSCKNILIATISIADNDEANAEAIALTPVLLDEVIKLTEELDEYKNSADVSDQLIRAATKTVNEQVTKIKELTEELERLKHTNHLISELAKEADAVDKTKDAAIATLTAALESIASNDPTSPHFQSGTYMQTGPGEGRSIHIPTQRIVEQAQAALDNVRGGETIGQEIIGSLKDAVQTHSDKIKRELYFGHVECLNEATRNASESSGKLMMGMVICPCPKCTPPKGDDQ